MTPVQLEMKRLKSLHEEELTQAKQFKDSMKDKTKIFKLPLAPKLIQKFETISGSKNQQIGAFNAMVDKRIKKISHSSLMKKSRSL